MNEEKTGTGGRGKCLRIGRWFCVLLLLLPQPAAPYSVQTHEQLIDLTWSRSIAPLLQSRYPRITKEQLQEAHAYAYGGAAIQDLGYYPFGKAFFSDLTHYVRSGDFILSLIRDSHNPDELAFAVGALSHYVADSIGHPQGVNPSVGIEFPHLAERYGPIVTYEQGKHAHVRTEFAFDVNEIAKNRFASPRYLKHVGLSVPEPLLRRAFLETYGLDMKHSLGYKRPVVRGYRFAVRNFFPQIAAAEVVLHKNSMPNDTPGKPFDQLRAELAHADFENGWSQYPRGPRLRSRLLAALIFVLPKVGPLSDLAIRGPNQGTEELYVESLNNAISSLRRILNHFSSVQSSLPNLDLDTGSRTQPGAYRLTDETYASLIHRLAAHPDQKLPAGLKQDIALYYSDPAATNTRKDPKHWAQLLRDLKIVNSMQEGQPPAFPTDFQDNNSL